MLHSQEEWRPIPGHEGRYDVSTHGRVRSRLRGRLHILLSKLTEENVSAIRSASGTQDEIAAAFGISQSWVSRIRNGKVWRHGEVSRAS